MPSFIVSVCRIGYGFADLEIEAATEAEAREKALDVAGETYYSEKTADYEISGVVEAE